MITGLGFTEILAIFLLTLLFFGSKELPRFVREAGKLFGKARQYSDKFRREFQELARETDAGAPRQNQPSVAARKNALRQKFNHARENLPSEKRIAMSHQVAEALFQTEEYRTAKAVMLYVSLPGEVETARMIQRILANNKRLILPYCRPGARMLGIAEITDPTTQLVAGQYSIPEPIETVRDNFLKSDLSLVVCPGVAFDARGGRLGRGKGYYDSFLHELQGRIPIFGAAFSCQISDEFFPFDYTDIPVDDIIIETGPYLNANRPNSTSGEAVGG